MLLKRQEPDRKSGNEFSISDLKEKRDHEKNADWFLSEAKRMARNAGLRFLSENYTMQKAFEGVDRELPTDDDIMRLLEENNGELPEDFELTEEMRQYFYKNHKEVVAEMYAELHEEDILSVDETVLEIQIATRPKGRKEIEDGEIARARIHSFITQLQWLANELDGQYFIYISDQTAETDEEADYIPVNDRLPQVVFAGTRSQKEFWYHNDEEMIFVFKNVNPNRKL